MKEEDEDLVAAAVEASALKDLPPTSYVSAYVVLATVEDMADPNRDERLVAFYDGGLYKTYGMAKLWAETVASGITDEGE
ncbi:hypothetical protein QP405_05685 [Gleimia europaea]|uniref:hypothetical protein n=1 Tax=Gleimia europaea TaxID=66228 RepID=UPI0026596AB2|nr:hypothetical protein [Gleimia europaea]MDK7143349.1 hypothetical protein [Gleimia europaea]